MSASATIVSNLKNATVPTGSTIKTANAAGVDVSGMMALAQGKALEGCLALIKGATDGADPNLATINNILASLV